MSDPAPPTLDDQRWHFVLSRDASHDGQFVYAVQTTGIYCRPSCPSRRPDRSNVKFFESGLVARTAGFRACRRCLPDEVDARKQAVAQVRHLLETAEPSPTLAQLAQAVQLSPSHLQRVFKATTGISPKQYALALRGERLKRRLREGATVTTAQYDAGHSSSRTLYDRATDQLGMPPKRYQAGGTGQTIAHVMVESTLGPMLVAATARGLVAVRFGTAEDLLQELFGEYPNASFIEGGASLDEHVAAIQQHLDGRRPHLDLPRDVTETAFQQRVWSALQRIPAGETRSYTQVAEMIGAPTAVRAVARACASNPVALVVPCHRVLRQGGALGGYRWGVGRKQSLLERERLDVALTPDTSALAIQHPSNTPPVTRFKSKEQDHASDH